MMHNIKADAACRKIRSCFNLTKTDCAALQRAYENCMLCPRRCGIDRTITRGFCRAGCIPQIARAALHPWEEPCISGKEGSGTVFFAGCNLGCVFCQNSKISRPTRFTDACANAPESEASSPSLPVRLRSSVENLVMIFYKLFAQGANNINLVTADMFVPTVAEAIRLAKTQGFPLPFLLNTGSYLRVETLRRLDGLIDIYLPDFKFLSEKRAARYANAPEYPETARAAIREMVRQTGACVFDEKGLLKRGVLIRHLLLPNGLLEAKLLLKELYRTYGDTVYFSLLNQYTPLPAQLAGYAELLRPVTEREYDALVEYALSLGIANAYMQEQGSASESYIPDFA